MTEWKPIKGYEGLYEVSNEGNIKTLHKRYKNKSILKQSKGSRGYLLVTLNKNKKQTTKNVHRIVADAFLENPQNLPCINHKDQDKTNNNVNNLEWCTYQYNNTYKDRLKKSALRRSIPVVCVETGVIYESGADAGRKTGIRQSKISCCCNGNRKTAGGFHWSFLQ